MFFLPTTVYFRFVRKIALYGNGAKDTVKGGTGSRDVNSREVVCIEDGLMAAGFEVTNHKGLEECSRKLPFAMCFDAIARQRELSGNA